MKQSVQTNIRKRKHWRQFALQSYTNFVAARRSAGRAGVDGAAVAKATRKLTEWFGRRAKLVIQAVQRRAITHRSSTCK